MPLEPAVQLVPNNCGLNRTTSAWRSPPCFPTLILSLAHMASISARCFLFLIKQELMCVFPPTCTLLCPIVCLGPESSKLTKICIRFRRDALLEALTIQRQDLRPVARQPRDAPAYTDAHADRTFLCHLPSRILLSSHTWGLVGGDFVVKSSLLPVPLRPLIGCSCSVGPFRASENHRTQT